jgi:asparagine synthetase B (glutamine-hydrolysing)
LIEILDRLDPSLCWDGGALCGPDELGREGPLPKLQGAFAWVESVQHDAWRLARDALGINKIFWAHRGGGIAVAARLRSLTDAGYGLDQINAFPKNHVVDFMPGRPSSVRRINEPNGSARLPRDVDEVARDIRSKLDGYLSAIRLRFPASNTFVCLSGGLDSTGVAALAREHFDNLVAVTFDLKRSGSSSSEDRVVAHKVAHSLDMPVLDVDVQEGKLLAKLDEVLIEGMDWRDFNVHAALVNASLAEAISSASGVGDRPVIVLTGDLSNEFLADYESEHYGGETYYSLPRLGRDRLRAWLVDGVASTHREVGIFAAQDLTVVQPYAVAAEEYMQLPSEFLALGDRKQRLMKLICGDRIPEYVYSRAKVRAQVGDPRMDGGVLALCVDRGMTGAGLRRRFATLHGISDETALDRFMRAGRFRTATPDGTLRD